jgi:hypothetical protein
MLSVLDVEQFEEIERVETGIHPDGIAYLSR